MIETQGLRKVFSSRKQGEKVALAHLDLHCPTGAVYALLGPNGAGKTTCLRILSTLLEPTAGEALVGGYPLRTHKDEIRRLIGVVSYETGVYERMTPREIATYFGRLNDLDERVLKLNLERLLATLHMEAFADERTEHFSTGMRQKTVLLRALITDPTILLFDEPTAGLDLLTAKSVTDYIRWLRQEGKTILFSTHILWEAEKLADTIGIIHQGHLIAEGSLGVLRAQTGKADLEDIFFSLVTLPEEEEPIAPSS
jgi:sodium transport system ATP-binding protein